MSSITEQTVEITTAATLQTLLRYISRLPEDGIRKLAEQAQWLAEEAEIAALRAKYGTTPNAETIAAIEECRARKGKRFNSITELMDDLNNDDED